MGGVLRVGRVDLDPLLARTVRREALTCDHAFPPPPPSYKTVTKSQTPTHTDSYSYFGLAVGYHKTC